MWPCGINRFRTTAVLLNCSRPEAIDAAWPHMKALGVATGAYANGFTSISGLKPGDGVGMLEKRVDLGPKEYADAVMNWVNDGASVIGGCCEISPAHIAKLVEVLADNNVEIVNGL